MLLGVRERLAKPPREEVDVWSEKAEAREVIAHKRLLYRQDVLPLHLPVEADLRDLRPPVVEVSLEEVFGNFLAARFPGIFRDRKNHLPDASDWLDAPDEDD